MKTAKIWTKETLAFFKEIYASTSNAELAALLGISVSSIKKKASELKLIKTAGYKLTEDVKKTILEKYYTQSYESIAKDLHISKRTVLRFIGEQKKKGLKPRDRETDKKLCQNIASNNIRVNAAARHSVLSRRHVIRCFLTKKSIGYVSGFSAMAIYCNEME